MLFDIHIADDTPVSRLVAGAFHVKLTMGIVRMAAPPEYVDWRK
jgi:hypothetical protein